MLIYIHKSMTFNLRNDVCVSGKDKETHTFGISMENYENIVLSYCYRPPNDDSENLIGFLQNKIIERYVSEKKIAI